MIRTSSWLSVDETVERIAWDLTVYQIARRAGFHTVRTLERAFQRFRNRSPGEFKRRSAG